LGPIRARSSGSSRDSSAARDWGGGSGQHHHRVAVGIAHPGLLGGRPGDAHAGDVGLGQLAGAGVDPDVAVDVEEAQSVGAGDGVMAAESGLEPGAQAEASQLGQLAAQSLDLRGPVETEEAAQVGR
jgi:hypothetical protein